MDRLLSYEVLSRIFIECQRPELALISHAFYQVSQSITVQAETLIGIYGKDKIFAETGMEKSYPKLTTKENLVIALLRRGATISIYNELYKKIFEHGWIAVIKELLHKSKLVETIQRSELNQETRIFKLYSAKPLYDIGAEEYEWVSNSKPKNYIEILKLLDNAHEIKIDIAKEHKISPEMIAGGKAKVHIHPKINYNGEYSFNNRYRYRRFENDIYPPDFYEGVINSNLLDFTTRLSPQRLKKAFALTIQLGNQKMIDFILSHSNLVQLASNQSFHEAIKTGNMKIINDHIRNKDLIQNLNTNILEYEGIKNIKVLSFGLKTTTQNENRTGVSTSISGRCLLKESIAADNVEMARIILSRDSESHICIQADFRFACLKGNSKMAAIILEKHKDVHKTIPNLLIDVYSRGNQSISDLLIKSGADINGENGKLLKMAIRKNDSVMIGQLAELGAFLDLSDKKSIFNATEYGYTNLVEKAVSCGLASNIETINSCLILSIKNNHYDIFCLLLKNNADPLYQKNSPIVFACGVGNMDMVKTLISMGANIRAKNDKGFVQACKSGHYEIAKLAIEHGADVSAGSYKNEAFTCAYLGRHRKIVNLLVENGADKNLIPNLNFLIACERGDCTAVKAMLDNDLQNHTLLGERMDLDENQTQRHSGIKTGDVDEGIDINYRNGMGLVWACLRGNVDLVKLLIENGCNVKARKNRPLITACRKNRYEIAKLLIENGADLAAGKNRPLTAATTQNHHDIICLLLEKGASFRNFKGISVYWSAKLSLPSIFRDILETNVPRSLLDRSLVWVFRGKNTSNLEILMFYGVSVYGKYAKTILEGFRSQLNWEIGYDYLLGKNRSSSKMSRPI
ncbi:hypothetical protein BB559_002557 [Furculomyces boomerangus]|uniref:Ankyrin repeat protein n=1 Tax=Furculomyces boomerangus TaxID=61424 RepID=A0A2T9YU92_9FUNG|nr:hypothetical protein BB559_002557 [Furculomyces boomerangus]